MIQIIEQSDEKKLEMYMKCSKKELAKMLIEANKHLDRFTPFISRIDDELMNSINWDVMLQSPWGK